ncbi:MAG: hypothetical protein ACRDUA_04315, partial [Micromonosporaceae bacterium]
WVAPVQPGNQEFTMAAQALDRVLLRRYWDRLTRWLETSPSYPREWQQASDSSEYGFFATDQELAELTAEYHAVLRRHLDRWKDRYEDPSKRPPGARPVEVLTFAYPFELPGSSGQEG